MSSPIDSIGAAGSTSDASTFTQARQDAMNAAAGELGMSATDLRTALSSGETLTQLATSKGISPTDLQNTIESSLQKDLPNASATQLNNLSSRMMSGAHHAHGGHHAGGAGSAGGSSSASNADATGDGNDTSSVSLLL